MLLHTLVHTLPSCLHNSHHKIKIKIHSPNLVRENSVSERIGTDAVVEMGKAYDKQLPVVQQQQFHGSSSGASRTFICRRCTMGVYSLFSFKCAVVLILSVAAFISTLYLVLPVRHRQPGFDAKESIKLSATVQAYFKLQKPVSKLVPYISRLEYDINEEIGVPSFKVAVLSMHQARAPNLTDVVFGFLPDPINSTINQVALSVLKSSLVDLFLRESNLTLTSSIFKEPSSFEILKFPGGITLIPERNAFIFQIPQSLFNFTLNSTIYDIKQNLPELKEQLKLGLHLMPNEVVYIQVTNKHGSTKDPPVTVEASVASDVGNLLPERVRQLAQTITGSPSTDNLGLDHSVFGKVKEISLSSFLNHSLHAYPPSPSPNSHSDKIAPNLSPHAFEKSPLEGSTPQISPSLSPLPGVVYGSRGTGKRLVSLQQVSSSAEYARSCTWRIHLIGLLTFLLLFWIN